MMARVVVTVLLFATLVASNQMMTPWHQELFARESEERSTADRLLDVLGEIRTFLAKVLWFKADVYHHAFEGQGMETFKQRDMLAIYRLVTLLDPHFIDAYDVGAFAMGIRLKMYDEAVKFVNEGLKNNPSSHVLYFDKALILYKARRPEQALAPAWKAYEMARSVGLAIYALDIPDSEKKRAIDQQKIDALNALRILSYCYSLLGQKDHEVAVLRMWLEIQPGDPTALKRFDQLHVKP